MLHQLYTADTADTDKSCLVFTPALCAAVETAEALKLLVGREASLAGKLLLADLRTMDTAVLEL